MMSGFNEPDDIIQFFFIGSNYVQAFIAILLTSV